MLMPSSNICRAFVACFMLIRISPSGRGVDSANVAPQSRQRNRWFPLRSRPCFLRLSCWQVISIIAKISRNRLPPIFIVVHLIVAVKLDAKDFCTTLSAWFKNPNVERPRSHLNCVKATRCKFALLRWSGMPATPPQKRQDKSCRHGRAIRWFAQHDVERSLVSGKQGLRSHPRTDPSGSL